MDDQKAIVSSAIFKDLEERLKIAFTTPLNVIICGPGLMQQSKVGHIREVIRDKLVTTCKDNVFFIEELLNDDKGKKLIQKLELELGEKPSLNQIEINIMKSIHIDKDIHIAEGLGSLLELRDFEDYPIICKKIKIFTHKKYAETPSYANDLINRLQSKGVKVYYYKNRKDLVDKIVGALKHNRFIKYTMNSQ